MKIRPGRLLAPLGAALLLAVAGCPHRSPLWSPDGKHILLLGGGPAEDVDKAAPKLWLVEVEKGEAVELPSPEEGARFLAAVWLGPAEFAVATGRWDGEYVEDGSEKLWARKAGEGSWRRLDLPPPSGSRITRRLPVLIERDGGKVLVYPSGSEKVIAVSLETKKVLQEIEPAQLVGPGPEGGFLVYKESDSGGTQLAAIGPGGDELWTKSFSALRSEIAAKLGKAPVEVVFDDTSTSEVSSPEDGKAWVGVTLVFADVAWRDGISGYFARLDAADGSLLDAVGGKCVSGRPASAGGLVYCVHLPAQRAEPPAVSALEISGGKVSRSRPLEGSTKEEVHGYSLDPAGERFAVAFAGTPAELRIYDEKLEAPRTIVLP